MKSIVILVVAGISVVACSHAQQPPPPVETVQPVVQAAPPPPPPAPAPDPAPRTLGFGYWQITTRQNEQEEVALATLPGDNAQLAKKVANAKMEAARASGIAASVTIYRTTIKTIETGSLR